MVEYKAIEDWIEVKEPLSDYGGVNDLTYDIIGCCFEVHNQLGRGFLVAVYKDALEYELKKRQIEYVRERKFEIEYKEIVLPHFYIADFVVEDEVILEVKAQQGVVEENYKQVINYLAVSKRGLGLLINFGEQSLKYKRIALTK